MTRLAIILCRSMKIGELLPEKSQQICNTSHHPLPLSHKHVKIQ